MSRVLLSVWPLTGHLHPNLALAAALRRAGHDVAFYTGARAVPAIEAEGYRGFPFRAVDARVVDEVVLGPQGILSARRRPWRLRALWRSWVLDTVPDQVHDLRAVIETWKPDVLVTDPTMWAGFLILGELCRIPVAVFSLIPACHLPGPEGPIVGCPLPRPRGPAGRARARVLRGASRFVLADVRGRANALRARYGLAPIDCSPTEYSGRMPLYLVPGSREFDYSRRDLPPSVHYVGPALWDGGGSETLPRWVTELPVDQPLVYVSEGTVNLDPVVLRAAAAGLAGQPVQVIVTTGRHRDPQALGLISAPNVHIERWVPLAPLLPRLGALVTVGGPSTLLAGLNASVPAVVVPFDWDHPETAWRVAASGAGIRLAPHRCTPVRMRDAVMRVLRDPAYRRSAARLADTFHRAGGPDRAAALVSQLASRAERSVVWRAS